MRGREFLEKMRDAPFGPAREARIVEALLEGAIDWPFVMVPLPGGRGHFHALADYVALGEESDFVRTPLSAGGCQRIADARGMLLPTAHMVDLIWAGATGKLNPQPMGPPGPAMLSIGWFLRHNELIEKQRTQKGYKLGTLIAGDKKDVVLTNRLIKQPDRVAIYGWQQPNGKPIQPLSLVHEAAYADYSHGCRLIHPEMTLDGRTVRVVDVWQGPDASILTGNEGRLALTRYPAPGTKPASVPSSAAAPSSGRSVARALTTLLRQVDERWPKRARQSDGTWGDQAHQARQSDHNDGNALDITNDLANGPDLERLALAVLRDPRTRYVIYKGRIANNAFNAGAWRPYSGENAHTTHLHISVNADRRDDDRPWQLDGGPGRAAAPPLQASGSSPLAPAFKGLVEAPREARQALADVARELNVPIGSLATVIQGESGWDPGAPRVTSGLPRGGLVQLTRGANLAPYTTNDAVWGVRSMPAAEQLRKIVLPLFRRWTHLPANATALDLYKRNFLPADIDKPHDFHLGDRNSEDPWRRAVYASNFGFDHDKKGFITWDDVARYIRDIEYSTHGKWVTIDGRIVDGNAAPAAAPQAVALRASAPSPRALALAHGSGLGLGIAAAASLAPRSASSAIAGQATRPASSTTATGLEIFVTPSSTLAYMDRVRAAMNAFNVDVQGQATPAFQQSWSQFYAAWVTFYSEHTSWVSRLSGSVYDETEKYERQLEEWRKKFSMEGGKPSGPGSPPPAPNTTVDALATAGKWAAVVAAIFGVGYVLRNARGGS